MVLGILLGTLVPPGARADGRVTTWDYLFTSDGTPLRYTLVRPSSQGRFPVALIWSVYTDDVGPADPYPPGESPVIANALLGAGYAVLGVNMRGTGCSGGQWDLFQPASDGYEVVEWAAAQEWSTGDVGMFGFSAPGISQLLTAATRPPHLRAITPNEVSTDFYRDVAYPGGIRNDFVSAWTAAIRPGHEALSAAIGATQGDADCPGVIAQRPQPNDHRDLADFLQNTYDGPMWRHYSPERVLDQIDVPLMTCEAWQDDQVTSRAGSFWLDRMDPERSWIVATNGPHGVCDDYPSPYIDLVVPFFDRFVKGERNGFEDTARVHVWHETAHVGGANVPSWTTTYDRWPVPTEPVVLELPGEGADSYVYPLPASAMDDNEYFAENAMWKIPDTPGGFVSYTWPALTGDLEVFGPGSVDLWIASTDTDTDLQVTLTEVRPDGQEMYIGRGWLRASHRKLDEARSNVLRPYHTHLAEDARPLESGDATTVRIELNPIGHVFRASSALRLYVSAPSVTGLTGPSFRPVLAVNTVLHDALHPSRLVLGRIDGAGAPVGYPACDTLLNQPCR
jgi:hypothetical protein